jgi:hypothetical protein
LNERGRRNFRMREKDQEGYDGRNSLRKIIGKIAYIYDKHKEGRY